MSRPLWWRWSFSDVVHGPFTAIADVAAAVAKLEPLVRRTHLTESGIIVGTASGPHWNTAVFERVDELFDAANPMPELGDYPPSCAWTPAQLGELRAELEGALAAWLERHGHAVAPDAQSIDWHVAFTWEEIRRLAGAADATTPENGARQRAHLMRWPRVGC